MMAYTTLSIASHGKNRKILIPMQPIDHFWQNIALQTQQTNKILRIRQSKMAAAAILNNQKIFLSSQLIDRHQLCTPTANKILRFQKSKIAAAAILKIWKIAISPQQKDRFWRHLAPWWVWAFRHSLPMKFHNVVAAAILKNWKILISLQQIDRFWLYLGMLMLRDPLDLVSR